MPELAVSQETDLDFLKRAKGALDLDKPRPDETLASDMDLNPDWPEQFDREAFRPAAVLVPITYGSGFPEVILTVRSSHLPTHAGQIAFPGGKVEEADGTPVDTALREADEEIGLMPGDVQPLGYLDPYFTGTRFRIDPVLGLVPPDYPYEADPNEVAQIFRVPLSHVMEPQNYRIDSRVWNNARRRYYAVPFETHYIWGATAGILRRMCKRLYQK